MENFEVIKKGIISADLKSLLSFLQSSRSQSNSKYLRNKIFNDLQLKFLGSGVTASVFQLSTNRIVRIEFISQDAVSKKHKSGFYKWHKFCIDNQKLSIVPKIYGSYFIQNLSKSYFLVTVMEKLASLSDYVVFNNNDKASQKIQAITASKKNLLEPNLKVLAKLCINHPKPFKNNELIFIRNNFRGINDIHSGNIMFNKSDNRLVITDPIY